MQYREVFDMETERLTSASEDYLETMVELVHEGKVVRNVDIATRLDVSKASVNKAVSILKEAGYVTQEPYGAIELTPAGLAYGESILERHELLKTFLMEQLGVEEEVAEHEACEMEHTISMDTMQKWVNYLKVCGGCTLRE